MGRLPFHEMEQKILLYALWLQMALGDPLHPGMGQQGLEEDT